MSMRVARVLQPARALAMQPTRVAALSSVRMLSMRQSPSLMIQSSKRMMMPVPKEEHSAHTISQRLRTLKKIPMELLPLAFVLLVAVFAAIYSMARKLWTDRSLRLSRSGGISHRNQH